MVEDYGSQWSLTFEVRKRLHLMRPEMWYSIVSQWSLTFEVRKSIIGELDLVKVDGSQWSLTFEVRKS